MMSHRGLLPALAFAGEEPTLRIYSNYLSQSEFVERDNEREARRRFIFSEVGMAMTKDPVCGMKVDENNAKAQSQYHGQTYSFCSDECRRKFEQNPEQYTQSAA